MHMMTHDMYHSSSTLSQRTYYNTK